MIDKLLLNNQLLASKAKVRQAKVNVVNKLVHKIRKIKRVKEKKPDDPKLRRKIEKVEEVLAHVKKFKSIELMKRSLISDKNPTSVITNGNSTPQELAEALLFANKIISELTARLKELLHLNDSTNPGWRDQVVELSKRKKRLQQTKRKTGELQSIKSNEPSKKRNQWIEQDTQEHTKEEEEQSGNESEPDGWKIAAGSKRKFEKRSKPNSSNNRLSQSTQTVDPFFVTETGENYLSSVVIDRAQPEVHNDGLVRKERRAGNVGKGDKSRKDGVFRKYNKRPNKFEQGSRAMEKDLHSSYIAKWEQKGGGGLHEKEVNFGENSSRGSDQQNLSRKEKIMANNNSTDSNVNATKEKLHPSWEAKQKMKPTIAEFKGKKIVFGED